MRLNIVDINVFHSTFTNVFFIIVTFCAFFTLLVFLNVFASMVSDSKCTKKIV